MHLGTTVQTACFNLINMDRVMFRKIGIPSRHVAMAMNVDNAAIALTHVIITPSLRFVINLSTCSSGRFDKMCHTMVILQLF